MPQPAVGEVQIPQDGARPVLRQAGAAVNALGPRPAAGQVGQMAAAGQVGQMAAAGQVGQMAAAGQVGPLPVVGQVGQVAAAGQAGPLPAAGQAGQVAAAGLPGQLTAEEKLEVNWDFAYFLFVFICLVLCCSRSNIFCYFGTTAFPFHISRVVGLGDSFIIMSAKLVSWFFEVGPLGNGSFDVFHVVGRGSLFIVCLASCVPIYEIVGVFRLPT